MPHPPSLGGPSSPPSPHAHMKPWLHSNSAGSIVLLHSCSSPSSVALGLLLKERLSAEVINKEVDKKLLRGAERAEVDRRWAGSPEGTWGDPLLRVVLLRLWWLRCHAEDGAGCLCEKLRVSASTRAESSQDKM